MTASQATISPVLSEYLLSPPQLKALAHPYAPFPASSQSSKQDFESKTASIHLESADQRGPLPPINDLKREALELASSLGIDELSALRVVILEYQNRESVALVKASSSPTTNQVGGLFAFDYSTKNAGDTETDEEKREKALQQRIGIYLQERRYAIKCTTYLVRASFAKKNVLKEVGKRLVSELKIGDIDTLREIIKAIRSRIVDGDAAAPQWIQEKTAEDSTEGRETLIQWEKQVGLLPTY